MLTDTRPAPREVTGEPELQRSSCEVRTSTRGHDIGVKCYAGSPVHDAVTEAVTEYFRAFDLIEAELMDRGRVPRA